MTILGSHTSAAGGVFKAVQRAANVGCDCVQIFTSSPNRWPVAESQTPTGSEWTSKPVADTDIEKFSNALKEHKISHPIAHANYLINLASPKEELRRKSIEAMIVELQRADVLGVPYVVFHPGSFTTTDEETGLRTIATSLNEIHQRTATISTYPLLENTAGQGSNLGWKFEHLATLIDSVENPERLGVCIDTCHAFAAGYAMGTETDYQSTTQSMQQTFGLAKIKAFHINDSKKPFASRRDRHEHIGLGEMGLEPFRFLVNDPEFKDVPMYLETPKGNRESDEMDWDVINLKTVRDLVEA